jgi:hypothetical protein
MYLGLITLRWWLSLLCKLIMAKTVMSVKTFHLREITMTNMYEGLKLTKR